MKQKGFTLVELSVVVAIVAILASILLIGVGTFRSSARDARRIADLRQVQNALELYYNKKKEYPVVNNCYWSQLTTALTGAGIGVSSVPNDPNAAQTYTYCHTSLPAVSYLLRAQLENSDHPALKDDIDGTPSGLDCTDASTPYFCVGLF